MVSAVEVVCACVVDPDGGVDGVDGGGHQAGVGGGGLGGCWHHQATPQLPCAHHLCPARAPWKVATISSGKNQFYYY